MSKANTAAVWPLWLLLAAGWVLILAGVAALQQNCSSSDASSPLFGAGTVAYLSPVPCGKFFRFTWWITWYLFAILILLATFASTHAFHTFRAGLLGLSAPLLVLLMDTANTYFYFNGLELSSTLKHRARVTLAGSIIACVALGALLLVIGIFDEEAGTAARRGGTGEPKGETYGGVYQPTGAATGSTEAATYAYPTREQGMMAVRAPSAAWAWLSWLLMGAGWVIMLAGLSALQQDCGSSNVNALGVAGTAGYLAPINCNVFYVYAWWHVWYTFAMLLIVPAFLAAGWVHKWRMGLIGLLIPLVVLLQYTCDTFLGLWETGPQGGSQESRAKVLFSGSLICAISVCVLIILFGVYDEQATPAK